MGSRSLCKWSIFTPFFRRLTCLCDIISSPCVNEDDENFQWQSWIVSRGENNLIRFEGTEYCLYAGNVPANGNKVTLQPWLVSGSEFAYTVWTAYTRFGSSEIGQSPGAWWWYTDIGDDHIASTGQGKC